MKEKRKDKTKKVERRLVWVEEQERGTVRSFVRSFVDMTTAGVLFFSIGRCADPSGSWGDGKEEGRKKADRFCWFFFCVNNGQSIYIKVSGRGMSRCKTFGSRNFKAALLLWWSANSRHTIFIRSIGQYQLIHSLTRTGSYWWNKKVKMKIVGEINESMEGASEGWDGERRGKSKRNKQRIFGMDGLRV